jgi:hypothetical protein
VGFLAHPIQDHGAGAQAGAASPWQQFAEDVTHP